MFVIALTFKSVELESSLLLCRYICRRYGSSSYMKVIGLRSRSPEQKKRECHPATPGFEFYVRSVSTLRNAVVEKSDAGVFVFGVHMCVCLSI